MNKLVPENINESINFERNRDPKSALNLGIEIDVDEIHAYGYSNDHRYDKKIFYKDKDPEEIIYYLEHWGETEENDIIAGYDQNGKHRIILAPDLDNKRVTFNNKIYFLEEE